MEIELIGLNYTNATMLRGGIYTVLLTHYALEINFMNTIQVAIIYVPMLLIANFNHNRNDGIKFYALYNLLYASFIMIFAETVGHTIFEGAQSRPCAVLNAILFSPYFAVNGIKL